jgi:hypothetical protein
VGTGGEMMKFENLKISKFENASIHFNRKSVDKLIHVCQVEAGAV